MDNVPAIHPHIGTGSLPAVNHQAEFAAASVSTSTDAAILDGATALALTLQSAAATRQPLDSQASPRRA